MASFDGGDNLSLFKEEMLHREGDFVDSFLPQCHSSDGWDRREGDISSRGAEMMYRDNTEGLQKKKVHYS